MENSLQTTDAAELALQLDGNTLKKRNISVRRHKPSAKPCSEKSPSEKLVRHKGKEQAGNNSRETEDVKEKKRMEKKEKRRMRREGEKLLGIVKQRTPKPKGDLNKGVKSEANSESSHKKLETPTAESKQLSKLKFQGQTVENAKKKKVCT